MELGSLFIYLIRCKSYHYLWDIALNLCILKFQQLYKFMAILCTNKSKQFLSIKITSAKVVPLFIEHCQGINIYLSSLFPCWQSSVLFHSQYLYYISLELSLSVAGNSLKKQTIDIASTLTFCTFYHLTSNVVHYMNEQVFVVSTLALW